MSEPESPHAGEWPDLRDLLDDEGRAALRDEPGIAGLLREIHRRGPASLPKRSEAARRAALSDRVFRQVFPEIARCPWRTFGRRWRIRCAEAALDVARPNQKDTARRCGYASTGALTRAFRAQRGITPREFVRRRRRERRRPAGRDDSEE